MAPHQTQPLPDVWYRIQNVDYVTYLELTKPRAGKACVGRNLKESEKQWWKFVPQPNTKNTYQIVNAYALVEDTNFSLAIDASDNSALSESADTTTKTVWTVEIPKEVDYCTITTKDPKNAKGDNLNLELDQVGSVAVKTEGTNDDQKWRILEVSPSLPHDTYRIRNIDGVSVLTVHDNALALAMEEAGKHQGWEVFPKGNGKCVIKKLDAEQYLAWQEGEDGIIRIIISSKPVIWITKSFGGFAYSVCGITNKKPDLSLAITGNDEILLKPTKNAYGQVWFFEPSKFVLDLDHTGSGKRLSEIPDGSYSFQSISTSNWMQADTSGTIRHICYTSAKSSVTVMKIKYISATSPYFTIQGTWADPATYLAPSNDGLVASGTSANWYFAKDGNNEGYYICAAGKGKVARVITSATKTDVNSNYMFIIADKASNTSSQMWKVVK